MSTPAEIIAARVNGLIRSEDNGLDSNDVYISISDSPESEGFDETQTSLNTSTPSISDENVFPVLGGAKKSGVAFQKGVPSWGMSMKSPSPPNMLPRGPQSRDINLKSSVIQEAFSLSVEDQLNVARPEFIKILTQVKAATLTNIECTTSQHTKMRTFLITGKPEDVRKAKRTILKRLTKPVKIKFSFPAKLRSKVIGSQGKTIKKIVQESGVKIDIDQVEEENSADENDFFLHTVDVTVEGDVEGCKRAKAEILHIVAEESKNLTTQLSVDEFLKPFVAYALTPVVQKYSDVDFVIPDIHSLSSVIRFSGEKESVISAKNDVKNILDALRSRIFTVEVPIPRVKHQFLPIEPIYEKHNVLIKLPEDEGNIVRFLGERDVIPLAQEDARKETSQYRVEVLDMGKAHKGNLSHVRALATLLRKKGVFDEIAKEADVIIQSPDEEYFRNLDNKSIPIEIVVKGLENDNVKQVKKSIVSLVNSITPESTRVIDDIDEFLTNRIESSISQLAKENQVEFALIGNQLTLFPVKLEEESEDFDFDNDNAENGAFEEIDRALDNLRELSKSLKTISLDVPAEEHEFVSGPNGTTLKSIYSSIEPHSAHIVFGAGVEGPSEDKILIKGFEKSAAELEKAVFEVINDAKTYAGKDYEVSIDVPLSTLSRLIGKNGSNLSSLRQDFGVKIDVEQGHNDSEDGDDAAIVIISGVRRNVEECKNFILEQVKRWVDEKTVKMKIESKYHRRMIGPNGIYINRLQDKYNVRIKFPPLEGSNAKEEVIIKGSSKNVLKAEEELKELYKFEKENGFKEMIEVPVVAISRVIGKSGETIRDLADECGVEYHFSRDDDKEKNLGYTTLELTGSKSAIKEARSKIESIIEEAVNFVVMTIQVDPKYHKDLIGPNGSVMKRIISESGGDDVPRSRYFKLLTIPNAGSGSDVVTSQGDKEIVEKIIKRVQDLVSKKIDSKVFELELPKEKHRLIVGPYGTVRHALQDEFDVMVEVPRPNDPSTIIKLTGLPENVEQLKTKIAEITKDDWNISIDIPERYHPLVSERGAIFKNLAKEFDVEVRHGNLTRRAAMLSSKAVPSPSESAFPEGNEKSKFTIVSYDEDHEGDAVIPWRLKGSTENVEKAAKVIQKRLLNAENADSVGWFYSLNPSSFFKVVGSQGVKINKIRDDTDTFITVPRSNDKNPNFIYLVGAEANLNAAKEAIEALL